jgi:orotate phosphoribosyltransferase
VTNGSCGYFRRELTAATVSHMTTSPFDPTARKAAFITLMIDSGVLTFGDFVGKSGRKMPYFVNAGKYRTAMQVARLGQFYADAITATFGDDVDCLFGPAYKGIPLVTATAVALHHAGRDIAFCFDRKEAKDHGEGGVLVGHSPQPGEKIVIVEDVTTAGTSIRHTVPLLTQTGATVVGLVVGVDRQERGLGDRSALSELAEEFALTTVALCTIDDIVATLSDPSTVGDAHLSADDLARIAAYRAQYGAV